MRIDKIKDKKLKIYTVKIHCTIIILYKDFETARKKTRNRVWLYKMHNNKFKTQKIYNKKTCEKNIILFKITENKSIIKYRKGRKNIKI